VVLEKYPHAGPLLRVLENPGEGTIVGNGGEVGSGSDGDERDDDEEEEEEDDEVDKEGNKIVKAKKEVRIKFGIDATKLTMGKVSGRKKRKKGGTERGFDKIGFNFPHVGGKTKDVNRQVRFNQGESFQVRSFISLLVFQIKNHPFKENVFRLPIQPPFLHFSSSQAFSTNPFIRFPPSPPKPENNKTKIIPKPLTPLPFSPPLKYRTTRPILHLRPPAPRALGLDHRHPIRRRTVPALEHSRPGAPCRTEGWAEFHVSG
jgi:hypothetical protein